MAEKSIGKQLLEASTVGLTLVLSTVVGLAIGYGLDWFFKTTPWFMIIFTVLGIISGFRDLVRIAKKSENASSKKDI
jgi:ATP synthase protein I